MIEFIGACKVFEGAGGSVEALADFDLRIEEGETVCLIGTSGSGKTTALKMVNRLIEPTAGRVLVEGEDVAERDPIALRRGIGYVIQQGGLFPHMTVAANIALMCKLEGWSRDKARARAHELMSLVHLPPEEMAHRLPGALSGGQQQRVGLARALALDPPIILMDEPFGALDPITRADVRGEFLELERSVRKTTLLVTHDLDEAFELGDRIALMDRGRLIQVGTREDLIERPASEFVGDFVGTHASREAS